ncbi:MAG TPA: c-type cytochrome [Verrucomicrobiae bacterium]
MQFVMTLKQTLGLALALLTLSQGRAVAQETPKTEPGLMVTFTADGVTDATTFQNVWLFSESGKPVTPFLNPGKFTATWDGFISVDLRDNYTFKAELNGTVKIEVNTNVVLEATAASSVSEPSKRARLNKGLNPIKVIYTAPDAGDAYLRLEWSTADFAFEPLPVSVLSHTPGGEALVKGTQLRLGRELFIENRCVKCHVGPSAATLPDLALDAPDFKGIGSRRNFDWLAHWIENPKASRALAQMPKMVHGATAKADADAMAAYLSSLKDAAPAGAEPAVDLAVKGGKLFESLHCVACHVSPTDGKDDPKKIALKQVKQKFTPGDLAKFLQKPTEHYEWIRMPNFHLKPEEANELAAFLNSKADAANNRPAPAADAIARGKQLVTTVGCLSCHSGTDDNKFAGKRFGELAADKWTGGCLSETDNGKAPFFAFKKEEREALQAFAKTDRTSLKRHVPMEFAERHARNLNCTECHGKFEGFPVFNVLGGKLRPEWATRFIAGEVDYKPRPWIEGRMPGFPKYAEGVAHGLAAQHGLPAKSPTEPAIDKALAETGRQLIGTDGGFSCIACHAIGKLGATQVFESAGINLAYTGERLLPNFFHRWLQNPLRIDPQTKMPVYFDQGNSPLTDVLEGKADKQIEALWQYIRQGKDMPMPKDAQQ